MSALTFAHIVNPVAVNESSDLFVAQPVTFETMKTAAEAAGNHVRVELYTASYPEDDAVVPGGFTRLPPLEKSILDMGTFKKQKKLPRLKDILDRLAAQSTADYFIYTNVDIAVFPEFYNEAAKVVKKGYDAFVFNRRTIGSRYSEVKDIPLMIDEAKTAGKTHPGYDCFIFKREAYKQYVLGDACIGVNWIGRVLIANIMAFSTKFKVFEDPCLTFHIGDERVWLNRDYDDYARFNENQLIAVLETLTGLPKIKHKRKLEEFYSFHLQNLQSQTDIPENIIAQNSPVYRLPDKPGNIYHSRFKPSDSWENQNERILRQDPIFIAGYPRSGTTLVQALIATQKNIRSFPETHFFTRVRSSLNAAGDRVLGAIRYETDPDKWESSFNALLLKIRERLPFSKNAEEHIGTLIKQNSLSPKMLFEIMVIDNLVNQVDVKEMGAVRWMEKTPFNELFLDVIFRFYPSAKVIYVIRHPEKAIISRRKHFNLAQRESRWPVRRHIHEWINSVDEIEKAGKQKPGSVFIVKLEDIAGGMPEQVRNICDFLSITFDRDRLSRYKEISKTLYFPWEHWKDNTGKDISREMAFRKRDNLPAGEIEVLRQSAKEKMEKYGYRISRGENRDTPSKRILYRLREKSGKLLDKVGKTKISSVLRRVK